MNTIGNFGYVNEERTLAGCAFPHDSAPFVQEGFDGLVSLTQQPATVASTSRIELLHLPVADFSPPTLAQLLAFFEFVERKRKVVVHCAAGRGRTGTFLAAHLAVVECMAPAEAILVVRRLRPGSIETSEQENAVYQAKIRFSYVLEKTLAGCAWPHTEDEDSNGDDNFVLLQQWGIGAILTLTKNALPDTLTREFQTLHLPFKEGHAPLPDELLSASEFIRENASKQVATVVHCEHGVGRTGTVLAALLMHHTHVSAKEAIGRIRALRGSDCITGPRQEESLVCYEKALGLTASLEDQL